MIVHPATSRVRIGIVVYFTPLSLTSNNDKGLSKGAHLLSSQKGTRTGPPKLSTPEDDT